MSLNANTLFSTLSAPSAAAWKPVSTAAAGGGKSLVATAFSAPSAQGADSVDVSPLAKALTGSAAKVFEKLDGKARDMLEGYVKSGVLTADDVVKGLRGIAKQAVKIRYFDEAPSTKEEIEMGEKMRAIHDKRLKYGNDMHDIFGSFSKEISEVEEGNLDEQEKKIKIFDISKRQSKTISEYIKDFSEKYGPFDEEVDSSLSERRLGNNIRHSDIFSGDEDSNISSKKDNDAVVKLFDAGFRPALYRDAAKSFAAEVDLSRVPDLERPPKPATAGQSTDGRGATAPAGKSGAPAQPNASSSSLLSMTAAVEAETEAGTLARKTKDDPTVAMLRANANLTQRQQGYPAVQQGPDADEGALSALTRLLKDGTQSDKSGTKPGRTDTIV